MSSHTIFLLLHIFFAALLASTGQPAAFAIAAYLVVEGVAFYLYARRRAKREAGSVESG